MSFNSILTHAVAALAGAIVSWLFGWLITVIVTGAIAFGAYALLTRNN